MRDFSIHVEPVSVPLGGIADVDVKASGDFDAPIMLTASASTEGVVALPGIIEASLRLGTFRVGAEAPLTAGSAFTLRVVARSGAVEHVAEVSATVGDRRGSLDPSFADRGVFAADGDAAFRVLLVLPGGDIAAAGNFSSPGGYFFRIVRLRADGTLVGTLAGDLPGFPRDATAAAIGRQSSGRLILAGMGKQGGRQRILVVAVRPDVTLDPSFGHAGLTLLDLDGDTEAIAMAVAPDDKLILAGHHDHRPLVVRLLPDGTPDPSFGHDGFEELDREGARIYGVALARDGDILVTGDKGGYAYLARLPQSDPGGGRHDDDRLPLSTGASIASARKIVVQPDGRILVGGSTVRNGSSGLAVWRLLPDRRPDPSFSQDGLAVVGVMKSAQPMAGLALLPDGELLVATNRDTDVDADHLPSPLLVHFGADGEPKPSPKLRLGEGNQVFSIAYAGEGTALLGLNRRATEGGGFHAAVARVWD